MLFLFLFLSFSLSTLVEKRVYDFGADEIHLVFICKSNRISHPIASLFDASLREASLKGGPKCAAEDVNT